MLLQANHISVFQRLVMGMSLKSWQMDFAAVCIIDFQYIFHAHPSLLSRRLSIGIWYLFNVQISMQYSSEFTFPPGEHSAKRSCNCRSNLGSGRKVPITAGWPEAMWIQILPKAFTVYKLFIKNKNLFMIIHLQQYCRTPWRQMCGFSKRNCIILATFGIMIIMFQFTHCTYLVSTRLSEIAVPA